MPSACASDCNTTNIKPGSAADAARQRSEHDPGTHAEAFRSAVQRIDSARATSAMLAGRESPSPEVDASRPARMRHHCRAPNRPAPCSTGTPVRSAGPATPPSDSGLPQTTAAVAVHGPALEKQTGARRSGLGPRRDQSPRWPPSDCAGMSATSGMAVLGVGSCTWRPSTRRP